MKKTIIASAIMMMSASVLANGNSTDAGHGVVNFVGSIIDAPCSIAPESLDQTVQMGQISSQLLEKEGETPVRTFNIHLESCSAATAKSATITFDGNADSVHTNHLAITGTGKGGAVALLNQDESEIHLGEKIGVAINDGENTLNFGAKLVSNLRKGESATPGEFASTANFVMSYQ